MFAVTLPKRSSIIPYNLPAQELHCVLTRCRWSTSTGIHQRAATVGIGVSWFINKTATQFPRRPRDTHSNSDQNERHEIIQPHGAPFDSGRLRCSGLYCLASSNAITYQAGGKVPLANANSRDEGDPLPNSPISCSGMDNDSMT